MTKSGVYPINQASLFWFVVPVLPAIGTFKSFKLGNLLTSKFPILLTFFSLALGERMSFTNNSKSES